MEATIENTIVLIPSYNESRTIGSIVRELVSIGVSVLVVDDGSIDNTGQIAMDNGAMVLGQRDNKGKGASVRQGLEYILEKTSFEWLVLMDGDGQHHPEDVPRLMERTRNNEIDLVIGNRMQQTANMPRMRYWTNRFTSWVVSGICGDTIPDTQCGFRILRIESGRQMRLTTDKYDIESEMLIQAAEGNHRIASVPIRTIYGEEVSAINPVRDTIKFFSLIIRYHFNKRKKS